MVLGKVCVVKGCPYTPVCLDDKGYTLPKGSAEVSAFDGHWAPVFEMREGLEDAREIWYCREHAVQFLFPLIDQAKGNTMTDIMKDFAAEGML